MPEKGNAQTPAPANDLAAGGGVRSSRKLALAEKHVMKVETEQGSLTVEQSLAERSVVGARVDEATQRALAQLRRRFGASFELRDGTTGELRDRPEGVPAGDEGFREVVARVVAERGTVEIALEEHGLALLAAPVEREEGERFVAFAPFVIEPNPVRGREEVWSSILGAPLGQMRGWIDRQRIWDPFALVNMAELVLERQQAARREVRHTREMDQLSGQVVKTFEEISLIYGITQNLRISSSAEDLCLRAMDWLADCVSAQGVSVRLDRQRCAESIYGGACEPAWLESGACPANWRQAERLIEERSLLERNQPFVANRNQTAASEWPLDGVERMILVPIREGANCFGWMAAWNRTNEEEFGSVEANLMQSIASILGIHAGNHDLYRKQAELIAAVVRTLSAAIDAKDPYTCGHSDRVSRICVRLAQQMGLPQEQLDVLYMGGLLHDVGKIGIDDNILRKPSGLTDEEYAHIRLHPEMGYRIIKDIKPFEPCLGVVLHHHEAWNGTGYPHKLAGEEIPLLARIAAVADSYDAMTSDRPYRKGMPREKVERILREERGAMWDPIVVDAYFACSDDIERIFHDPTLSVPVEMADGTQKRLA
ncbi:MAG TPA: HD-GYP domain-containing protein [Pirellulaceae bacterium]|jgi:hypothetical protein|nr:HD-GYP domain-containing protein [Pirellulaceae bacterium]